MAGFSEIDAATAKQWVDAGEAVLVDVRETQELAQARIDGAHHMPMSALTPDNVADSVPETDGRKVVFFCAVGQRSYQVGAFLVQEGHMDEACSMDGGIMEWVQAGLPFESG